LTQGHVSQRLFELAVMGTGRLEGETFHAPLSDPGDQRPVPLALLANRRSWPAREYELQAPLGDFDTDGL
jgi:hypothetical protein